MKKLLISAFVIAGFATTSNGQATASASATAVIVTPISIVKATGGDMHFGNIATNGTAGTVIIATDGGRSYGVQGGLTFPAAFPGAFRQATFDVAGNNNYTYAITLPGTVTLTSGGNTMTVNTWTTDGTTNTTGLLSGTGTDQLNIGATLNVGAGQAAGTYTHATGVTVTVNYN